MWRPSLRAKRLFDLAVAGLLLLVLSPLLILVSIVIKLTSRGPVLFRQARVGYLGEPFTMLKFRSMVCGTDDHALREQIRREMARECVAARGSFKLPVDHRVTSIGRWIRRTSVDELPQLINVIRGEMSLVGPRPCLQWEHELFEPEFRRRVEVPPGVSGLWQTNGRSTVDTRQMLALDLKYLECRDFKLDVSICFQTLSVVARGDGAQ